MSSNARRGRLAVSAAGVVLAVVGVVAIVIALRAQRSAPQPPKSASSYVNVIPSSSPSTSGFSRHASSSSPPRRSTAPSTPLAAPATKIRGPVLAKSKPVALRIPAIGVNTSVHPLGLNPDHTVEVPPLSRNSYAGWYKYSPAPGTVGPSVILGHIDSAAYGPAVFYRLGDLRQRDKVYVTRADGTVAVFEIERVAEYPKNHFPTLEVYGNTDHAALRLITCGGKFDFTSHNYEDNIVAYASLVSSHRKH